MATHWRGPLYIVKSDGSFVQFVDENGEIVANVDLGDINDANGNEMLELDAVASAVNYFRFANSATGSAVVLSAQGDDTNVSIQVTGKGTGYVGLGQATSTDVRLLADQPIADSSGNEYFKFSKTASAVNEITITNNSTGLGPIIAASGETNVPITLRGVGTGAVLLGQATSLYVSLVADQPLADSSGNEYFKFSKTASAINELTIANGATAGTVAISVTGSDTVVCDFTLTGKTAGAATVVGGAVSFTAGAGNTSGTGGAWNGTSGAGGATGAGGDLTLGTGAGGTTSGVSGSMTVKTGATANATSTTASATGDINIRTGAPGTATTGTGGAAGAVNILARNGGATTGTAGTGGVGSAVNISAGNGGAASGGSDVGGAGGNIVNTPGTGGTGATAGRNGMIYNRGPVSGKFSVTALTTSATLTGTQMIAGMYTANQGGGAGATYTTPTGAELAALLPSGFTTGDSFDFWITNISTNASEDATLAAGASVAHRAGARGPAT